MYNYVKTIFRYSTESIFFMFQILKLLSNSRSLKVKFKQRSFYLLLIKFIIPVFTEIQIIYLNIKISIYLTHNLDNWRPPSLSELTPMILNMGLTHF